MASPLRCRCRRSVIEAAIETATSGSYIPVPHRSHYGRKVVGSHQNSRNSHAAHGREPVLSEGPLCYALCERDCKLIFLPNSKTAEGRRLTPLLYAESGNGEVVFTFSNSLVADGFRNGRLKRIYNLASFRLVMWNGSTFCALILIYYAASSATAQDLSARTGPRKQTSPILGTSN